MKALLVIFTICISYAICQGIKSEKVYPKKYKTYANGKILINSVKYEKPKNPPPVEKKPGPKSYTVFQNVGNVPLMNQAGVPDSPYFPVDQGYDQKSRVKKVLPDYTWSALRSKRSADVEVVPPADEKKEEPKAAEVEKETTAAPTAATTENKEVTTVKEKKIEPKAAEVEKETTAAPTAATTENKEVTTVKEKKIEPKAAEVEKETTAAPTAATTENKEVTTVKTSSPPITEETKSTTKASTTTQDPITKKDVKRSVESPKEVARKGPAKPKPKAAPKKNSARAISKPKSKPTGKNAAARAKPKAARAKPKAARAKPKGKRAKPETRRLTAAREALIEDYPYVVSIQKNEQHWCSGALLNPRLVITTANCLWKANRISRMEVRAGSRHTNHGGQMAGIQEVMKHPNWGLRKSPDNDVALVLLNRNIRFSDSVHGVDLPNRVMLPPFDDAWITSWGAERRDGVYDNHESTTLQVFHARLIDREKCNNVTMRFSVIVSENFICLAQSGRQAPCTRDTGAPAVSDGILWGLASWGIRKLCGTERYPAVFSYLASHSNMDFLMNATHYLMSDKRQYPYADRYPGSLMEHAK